MARRDEPKGRSSRAGAAAKKAARKKAAPKKVSPGTGRTSIADLRKKERERRAAKRPVAPAGEGPAPGGGSMSLTGIRPERASGGDGDAASRLVPDPALPLSRTAYHQSVSIVEIEPVEDHGQLRELDQAVDPLAVPPGAASQGPDGAADAEVPAAPVSPTAPEPPEPAPADATGDAPADAEAGPATPAEELQPPEPTPEQRADEARALATSRPAVAVLLTHAQAWRLKGVALGRLQHSLCLAPGEVTQVAMVDWTRQTSTSAQEDIDASEDAGSSRERTRGIQRVADMVSRESLTGSSETSSTSESSEGGVSGIAALFGASASGAGGHTSATQVNRSSGERQARQQASEAIRQRTHQNAKLARSQRATLVQEIAEQQTEEFRTRVVANYNHMHALNMQYYEVVQVYEMTTQVRAAQRCLFLPMEVLHFAEEHVVRFHAALARGAEALGMQALAGRLRLWADEDARRNEEARLNRDVEAANAKVDEALALVTEQKAVVEQAQGKLNTARQALDSADAVLKPLEQQLGRLNCVYELLAPFGPYERSMRSDLKGGTPALMEIDLRAITQALRQAVGESDSIFVEWGHFMREARGRDQLRILQAAGVYFWKVFLARWESHNQDVERARVERVPHERATQDAVKELQAASVVLARYQERHGAAAAVRNTATSERHVYQHGQKLDIEDVLSELNARQLEFNQAIWVQMDAATVGELIAGRSFRGESLAETLDPGPVAVTGNLLGFRWNFGPRREDGRSEPSESVEARHEAFEDAYLGDGLPAAESPGEADATGDTLAVPTGALFAEAVLGRANSAERLDLTRFWHWDANTIPIRPTAIGKLSSRRREAPDLPQPGDLGAPELDVQAQQPMPGGPGRQALDAVLSSSMFRDMSGAAAVNELAQATMSAAADGASDAAHHALNNLKNALDHYEKVLPQLAKLASSAAAAEGGVSPTMLGALKNSVGGEGLDPAALIARAKAAGFGG